MLFKDFKTNNIDGLPLPLVFYPHEEEKEEKIFILLYCTATLVGIVAIRAVLHCTTMYCTVMHCTAIYCTVMHCTALKWSVLNYPARYCTILYDSAWYCSVLYSTVVTSTAGELRDGHFFETQSFGASDKKYGVSCSALHCTSLHSTAQHCTKLHCLHCTDILDCWL